MAPFIQSSVFGNEPSDSEVPRAVRASGLEMEHAAGNLETDFRSLDMRDLRAEDALLKGDYESATDFARAELRRDPTDLDTHAAIAMACAFQSLEPSSFSLAPLQLEFVQLLSTLAASRESASKAGADLDKLVLNFRSLRSAKAASGLHALFSVDTVSVSKSRSADVFAASPKMNLGHWAALPPLAAEGLFASIDPDSENSLSVVVASQQFRREPIHAEGLNHFVACELSIASAIHYRDFQRALSCARCLFAFNDPKLPEFGYQKWSYIA